MGQLMFSWTDNVIRENPQWFFRDAHRGIYDKWNYSLESGFPFSSWMLVDRYGITLPRVDMQQCVSQRCQGIVYVTVVDNSYRYSWRNKSYYTYDDMWMQSLRYNRFNFQLAEDKMIFDMQFGDCLCEPISCLPEHESFYRERLLDK